MLHYLVTVEGRLTKELRNIMFRIFIAFFYGNTVVHNKNCLLLSPETRTLFFIRICDGKFLSYSHSRDSIILMQCLGLQKM